MKIIYILGLFGILVIANKYGIYYPTSYKAFIPKQWDSEYKEYERLCKEKIGKVVYARPILDIKSVDYQTFMWFLPNKRIIPQVLVVSDLISKKVVYIKIVGFHYDTSWSSFYIEWFIMPHTEKNYIGCDIENIASHISPIKQIIGENFDDEKGFSSYDWYMLKILFGENNE
ncbi:hypothetical protein DCO58_04380 [Helicobacter saguini]|uniref:Uncharacterized protein n=1 Tax=Helicobacter saguini TaxID=1548018 RepID=A0A347W325_9HELI|nr:hypothetical protein [Helicobacter saguini]MWV62409.1 hypothetical protein [Helicobacter saguini]MWV66919.1 hypothetical protein [Helicobacter saguini]MWV69267.1 hypothetical protein [Helicobacter saguini]MWV71177.1 hypothetical protein [Helicobacter saguini]TLD94936.1 hypothetical protein LS64_003155 [Helicobacter saguini]